MMRLIQCGVDVRRGGLRVGAVAAVLAMSCVAGAAVVKASSARATGQPRAGAHERTPGYLGIEFHDTPTHNVEVMMVDHDGPAGKAGLEPHDLIVKMNGLMVESADGLKRMIHESGAGAQVMLAVMRSGRNMTLTAQLEDRDAVAKRAWQEHMVVTESGADDSYSASAAAAPVPAAKPQGFIENMLRFGPYTGLSLTVMEPQLANYFGAPNNKGLLVHEVEANSPGATAGLRAGDVLVRADGMTLATTSDWSKSLHASKGRAVSVTLLRERHEMTVTLMPDAKKRSMVERPVMFGDTPLTAD